MERDKHSPSAPDSTLTDEILFARFQRGDASAFDIILSRYRASVFHMILRSVYNRQRAEEVFQECFKKIIEGRDNFKPTVSFKAWLFTIVRNTCIDEARKRHRQPGIDSIYADGDDQPLENKLSDDRLRADEEFSGAELKRSLDLALQKVPEEQRQTFYLRVVEELTFEEIGESMSCSTNTAKSRMRYALEQLRDLLKKRKVI